MQLCSKCSISLNPGKSVGVMKPSVGGESGAVVYQNILGDEIKLQSKSIIRNIV